MKICILYGTESGNAELVADDLALALEQGNDVIALDMQGVDPTNLDNEALHLIICSTHGEGNLPESAVPFADRLDLEQPNLAGIRYAMFGLGDSTYEHYSRGSELVDERLSNLGAVRFGAYGRHDASAREEASALAIAWSLSIVDAVTSELTDA